MAGLLKSPSRPPGFRWEGEGNAHFYGTNTNSTLLGSLAPGESEVHLYLRIDFDRLSVQQIRLVLPLLHGFDRGRGQHWVSADQLQVLDVAVLADLRLQTRPRPEYGPDEPEADKSEEPCGSKDPAKRRPKRARAAG